MQTSKCAATACILFAQALLANAPQAEISFPVHQTRIAADLYGAGPRGVVIVGHGGYSTRRSWQPEARTIADAGFQVLVFETRAAMEFAASGKETPCFYDEVCQAVDVLAAVRELRTRGAKTVAAIGGSMGGAAVAHAAVDARAGEIDRVVLLAPAEIAAPEKIQGRKLFLVARDDANSAGPRLPGIRAQFNRTREPKSLVLLDGSAHAQRIFQTPQRDQVLQMIVGFLSKP